MDHTIFASQTDLQTFLVVDGAFLVVDGVCAVDITRLTRKRVMSDMDLSSPRQPDSKQRATSNTWSN